jgi:large subunit ribosomal protein L9
MNVLLLEDVYKLGRAGQVKKVPNGFGRNFLIPQGLAVPASKNAVLQAERITASADKRRDALNSEMTAVAEKFTGLQLLFPARAGETGKLYGSVTTQDIAQQLSEKTGVQIDKRQIHGQPLRLLGMHKIGVRLTVDVIPQFEAVVYREGESPENYMIAATELAAAAEAAQAKAQPKAETAKPEAEGEKPAKAKKEAKPEEVEEAEPAE